ncbi:MAG: YncE family protein [Saprospiraceae bacterium]
MQVTRFFSVLFSFYLLLAWSGCRDSKDCCDLGPDFSKGVLVVNEGPFGGTGSISWYDPESGSTVEDLFGQANQGAALGQFVQSLTFIGSRAYICVNGAGKVVVVDARTFEYVDTLRGIESPRYMLDLGDGRALVSQWSSDPSRGIAIVDLSTLNAVGYIPAGNGPNWMLRLPNSNEVLVTNSGGFGSDNSVSRINVSTRQEVERIALPQKNPTKLVRRPNGDIFVHCSGYFLDPNPMGWIGMIDGSQGFETGPYGGGLSLAPNGQTLYYFDGNGINEYGKGLAIAGSYYGLACDPKSGDLYCANPRDFNSKGFVEIFSADYKLKGTFNAGVAPSEIIIRY